MILGILFIVGFFFADATGPSNVGVAHIYASYAPPSVMYISVPSDILFPLNPDTDSTSQTENIRVQSGNRWQVTVLDQASINQWHLQSEDGYVLYYPIDISNGEYTTDPSNPEATVIEGTYHVPDTSNTVIAAGMGIPDPSGVVIPVILTQPWYTSDNHDTATHYGMILQFTIEPPTTE